MVWGAVVIGRPIGPGMYRRFGDLDFLDFKNKGELELKIENPIEVVCPAYLKNPKKVDYREGILANIYFEQVDNSRNFEKYVSDKISCATEKIKTKLANYESGRVVEKPWISDLDFRKVCGKKFGENGETIWIPYIEIIDIYSDNEKDFRYETIARDFASKTRALRIQREEKKQNDIYMRKIRKVCSYKKGFELSL